MTPINPFRYLYKQRKAADVQRLFCFIGVLSGFYRLPPKVVVQNFAELCKHADNQCVYAIGCCSGNKIGTNRIYSCIF